MPWNYGEVGRMEVFDHFAEVVKAMGRSLFFQRCP